MSRVDPPHDASVAYTLTLVFSPRALGSVRQANAAPYQGSQATIARARELVAQYGARAELRDDAGQLVWTIGRGGGLWRGRSPGRLPRRQDGAADVSITVRVQRAERDRIIGACAALDLSVTEAVRLLPTLLRVVRRVGPALEWHPPVPLPPLDEDAAGAV